MAELKEANDALANKKEQFRKWRHSHKNSELALDFSKLGGNTKQISSIDYDILLAQFQEHVVDKQKASETLIREVNKSKIETGTLRAQELNFSEVCKHFELKALHEDTTPTTLEKYVKLGYCTRKPVNKQVAAMASGPLKWTSQNPLDLWTSK